MKKFILSHLVAIALVALSLTTFGCVQPTSAATITSATTTSTTTTSTTTTSTTTNSTTITTNSPLEVGLVGNWTSTYNELFAITNVDLTNSYAGSSLYAGNDIRVVKISDTAGTIFIKYTSNTYTPSVVGKWYAVSYKNLTSSSVSLSAAYKASGSSGTTTLDEAISEFTIENGYFGIYSECVKQ
jgi:hypothetical protein